MKRSSSAEVPREAWLRNLLGGITDIDRAQFVRLMDVMGSYTEFFKRVAAALGAIPRRGILYIVLMAVVSALYDYSFWIRRSDTFTAPDIAFTVAIVVAWFVVSYLVAMMMLRRSPNAVGGLKFVTVSAVLLLPALLLIGLLLLSATYAWPMGVLLAVLMLLPALILMSLFVGWPVAQAISARGVSPARMFRSTSGYRGPLIVVGFAISGIERTVPATSTAGSMWEAIALVSLGGLAQGASAVLLIGVAVATSKPFLDQVAIQKS